MGKIIAGGLSAGETNKRDTAYKEMTLTRCEAAGHFQVSPPGRLFLPAVLFYGR